MNIGAPSRERQQGGALLKLLIFLLIFGGILTAAWIFFLPTLLTSTLERRTGFSVKVTRLSFNPFTSRVDFEGLILTNPPTFPRREFVQVRSFYANAEFRTLWGDRPVINEAFIDVAQVGLVRNSEGTLNARLFNDRLFPLERVRDEDDAGRRSRPVPKPVGSKDSSPAKVPAPKAPPPPMQFLIKRLEVKLDRILIEDSASGSATSKEYVLNFSQTYENVTDPKQLLSGAAMRSLSSVGSAISGLIPGDMGKAIEAATKSGKDLYKGASRKSGDALKGLVDTLEETKKP